MIDTITTNEELLERADDYLLTELYSILRPHVYVHCDGDPYYTYMMHKSNIATLSILTKKMIAAYGLPKYDDNLLSDITWNIGDHCVVFNKIANDDVISEQSISIYKTPDSGTDEDE